jgi:hypothetical protein
VSDTGEEARTDSWDAEAVAAPSSCRGSGGGAGTLRVGRRGRDGVIATGERGGVDAMVDDER